MEHIKLQKYNAPFRVSIQKKVSEDIAYAALWHLLSHRVREGCRERRDLYYCNGQYVNSDKNMYQMSLRSFCLWHKDKKHNTASRYCWAEIICILERIAFVVRCGRLDFRIS